MTLTKRAFYRDEIVQQICSKNNKNVVRTDKTGYDQMVVTVSLGDVIFPFVNSRCHIVTVDAICNSRCYIVTVDAICNSRCHL